MAKRLTAFLILCLLVSLFGCSHNSPQSSVSSSAYALCATTSSYSMAESEDGIYTSFLGHLYYADKDNLSSWTPVCNKPNCDHTQKALECDAKISGSGFYLQQNRIYYCDSDSNYGGSYDLLILSMSPSGGDRKIEHTISFPSQEHVLQWRNCCLADRMLLFCACMDESGTFHNYVIQVTPEGDQILAEGRTENMPSFLGTVTASERVGGDTAVLYCLDSDNGGFGTMLYRLTESELVPIADTANLGLGDLVNCDMTGAYLTGNVLQVYRPNDGYYDINLTTGAQTKTMDVQMEDSWGWHLTDQYILESPLLFNRPEQRLEISAGPHSMLLYDGETWKSVTLPAEIAQISGTNRLFPNCVTSDRVIFTFDDYDNYKTNWYYLILDQENPELVPMCSIEFDI